MKIKLIHETERKMILVCQIITGLCYNCMFVLSISALTDRFDQLLSARYAGGLIVDSQAGQIEYSVANGSPPLPRFFRAVLPRR